MIKLLSFADLITLVNALLGFLAIVMVFLDELHLSFSFIFLAMLADGLDGIVARKTRHGELGEYLEAMADMTSLGIAPSLFIYNMYIDVISNNNPYHVFLIAALIVFLLLSIIRLASFHIMKNNDFFVGLPASAGTIILIVLTFLEIDFFYIVAVIIVISLAMVSNLRFPKPNLKIYAAAALLIILTLILGKSFHGAAPMALIIAVVIYAIAGPFYLWKRKNL